MRSMRFNVLSTVLFLSLTAAAGDAIQLSDIFTGFAGASSSPQNFIDVGGKCFFSATDGTNGFELYVSDGFSAGTGLVRDIFSGPGSSSPQNLTNLGGVLFFTANDGSSGIELWKSDGTAAGTVLVKDIRTGPGSSSPSSLTVFGGQMFFSADDGTNGRELWKSDGTAAGTVQVKDINPGTAGASIATNAKFVAMGANLFFAASDGNGGELWKTDGTTAGTLLVKEINATPDTNALNGNNEIVVLNGTTLLFPATDVAGGRELWKSDGTDAGTVQVANINAGSSNSNPDTLTVVGAFAYFRASNLFDTELYRTDGTATSEIDLNTSMLNTSSGVSNLTAVGTTLYCRANFNTGTAFGTEVVRVVGTTPTVVDINPNAGSSLPTNLTAVGSLLLCTANDGTNGVELVSVNGVTPTTYNINATGAGVTSSPNSLRVFDSTRAVFIANNGSNGAELYLFTAPSTVSLIRDINPGSDSGSISGLTIVNLAVGGNTFFFSANDGFGSELYKSDTTGAGTIRVKDLNGSANSSSPTDLTDFNGTLFFSANENTQGTELYKSNGTPAGTLLANDILAGAASSVPSGLKAFNGQLFFSAIDATNGFEAQKSNGATVSNVADLEPGTSGSFPSDLKVLNNALFFQAFTTAIGGFHAYTTDGTTTQIITEGVTPTNTYGFIYSSAALPNMILFAADTFDSTATYQGIELWRADGTTATFIKDINPGVDGFATNFTTFNGMVYFTADDGVNGRELWRTDGTAGNTVMLKDIIADSGSSDPANLTVVGNLMYFTANDGASGIELWKTDGTAAGTVMVNDIFTGSVGSNPHSLTNLNGTLLFAATDGVNGFELWKSDGTAAGTTLVKDINPGAGSSMPPINLIVPILPAGTAGRAVFAASNGVSGTELWKTNGSADGTLQIQDINPGSSSSTPDQFTVSGNFVYFTANNGANGKELWALALSTLLDPPVITTLPVAVGAAGTAFNFQIGLTGTEPLTVTSTELPPGLVLSGSSISGTPTTPGTYMVTITVTNSSGTATQGLKIIVTGDGVSNSTVDTDSDGFADEIEVALGLDPKNGAVTPFNGSPAGTTIPLNVQKLTIALDFVKPLKDQISFNGLIGLPVGFSVSGQSVTASIGGAIKTFALDAKGQLSPKSKTESFKLAFNAAATTEQLGKYSLKFSKGTFGSFFTDEGLTSVTVKEALKSVTVTLLFNGRLYQTPVTQLYTATAGKKGKTAQPSDGGGNLFPTR